MALGALCSDNEEDGAIWQEISDTGMVQLKGAMVSSVLIVLSSGSCGDLGGGGGGADEATSRDGGWGVQGTWVIAESLPRVRVPP